MTYALESVCTDEHLRKALILKGSKDANVTLGKYYQHNKREVVEKI
jgi:hypothetical protein